MQVSEPVDVTGGGTKETEGAKAVCQVWITRSNTFRAEACICVDSDGLLLIIQAETMEMLDIPLTSPINQEQLLNRRNKMMSHRKKKNE